MAIPLTRTKIIVPRRHTRLISRQRLLDLLEELMDYKLIIIAAPAGSGKTSLLIDMAHHTELPVCWYALDPLDTDPQRFIAHFLAAIAHRFPDFGEQSAAYLQAASQSDLDLDRLVTSIVNDVYEHIQEHFIIILDDYHFVDSSPAVSHFVSRFIQEVAGTCHLILPSRTVLDLPDIQLMVARSQVAGLGFQELAFQADEIQMLVRQNYDLEMPTPAAEDLAHQTEGWITGLLLSAETLWQGMTDRIRLARISGVKLHDYLAQQVLDKQPAPVRDFLLRTSPLEEFDAQLCEAVLGPADYPSGETWDSLIEYISQNILFVVPVDDQRPWLRYHHLFRDFLRARLAEESPDEEARILRRLARLHAERQEWDQARQLHQRLGDVPATADLIEKAGSEMVKGGRYAALSEWLDALPADVVTSRPALLSLSGIAAVMLGEVERGLRLLNQAVEGQRLEDDPPPLAQTLLRRAVAHRFLGQCPAALTDAEEAMALTASEQGLVQAEALRIKGVVLSEMGQVDQAAEWLERSLTAYDHADEPDNVAMVLLDLGGVYEKAGLYDQALSHYDLASAHWQKTDNVVCQANLLNNLGVLHHRRGDYEEAYRILEKALASAEQSGYSRIEAFALASLGDLYTSLDAFDAASTVYGQAREVAQRLNDQNLLLHLDLAEATLAGVREDLAQARHLLDLAGQLIQESHSTSAQGLYQKKLGQLALSEGKTDEAVKHLEEATNHFRAGGQRAESTQAYLYLASACHAIGDSEAALAHLQQAFRLAFGLDSRHPLMLAARSTTALLDAVRDDPDVGPQATQLLEYATDFTDDIPRLRRQLRLADSTLPFTPPSISIQALGETEIVVDGEPVKQSDWQIQSAHDLFFCLLAHPDGLTKEAVGLVLWPDCSPSELKVNFKNTIYRLRRAVGSDTVLFDEGRYHFNWKLDYRYDVEDFQDTVARAQSATSPDEQIKAYRAAVEIYKHPYLPDVEGTWILPKREELWRAYVEAVIHVAEFYLRAKEYRVALTYCQRLLADDPCLESAHRLTMRIFAAMGNRADVHRQFERCRLALLEEINVPPSPQTQALYQTLMKTRGHSPQPASA